MQIYDLSEDHEAAFFKMMEDYERHDPESFEHFYGEAPGWTPAAFRKFVKEAEKARMDWRPKAKKTSVSRYVMLEPSGAMVASGFMRFPLDAKTEFDGGNLEVAVPPSMRGKGFGSVCLSLLLFEAVRAGLRRVLATCPATNAAARRVIEKNRGVLLDVVPSKTRKNTEVARYWISFS